jgi:ribosomal protein S18 acetylase RimI-like enzyme
MIRSSIAADVERITGLTEATGFFRPDEIETLRGVLDEYFEANPPGHACYTSEHDGKVDGFVYLGPEHMTDGTWYVWWIAVDPSTQGRGVGHELLTHAETEALHHGGRVMFVETSGLPEYESTRHFYERNGYDKEAVLRDLYRDGDDMVIFRKRLIPKFSWLSRSLRHTQGGDGDRCRSGRQVALQYVCLRSVKPS